MVSGLSDGELPDIAGSDVVVVGCDSMLLIDGELQGKPATADPGQGEMGADVRP